MIWNLLGGTVPALVALISISLLVIMLASEAFVFVSLMLSLCLFLQVYDFGFSRALHYFQTNFSDVSERKYFLESAVWLSFAVGSVATLILWFLMPLFAENWLAITADSTEQISQAFQITSLAVLPSVMMHVYKGYMEAAGAFKAVNISKIIAMTSLFAGTVICVMFDESLLLIAVMIVLSRFFSLWVYIRFASTPFPRFSALHTLDLTIAKQLFGYTALAGFVGLVSAGFIYGDRFFVTRFINATDYSIYVVSQDYISRFLLLPWSLAMVLIPVINSGIKSPAEKSARFQSAYMQISWLSAIFVLFTVSVVIWLLPLVLSQNVLEQTQFIVLIILAGVVFGAFAQIPLIGLFAIGRAKLLCWIFAAELLIYFSIAPWCLREWGVMGAAWIWSGRLAMESILLNYFFNKAFKQL